MKQPNEGVTGTARDDFLLSMDERATAHRDALAAMATHLHTACLVGNPAPVVQRMYDRMRDPQPGDLVVETSTRHATDLETRHKRLGILIEHREEWWETDQEWEAYKAEDGTLTDADRRTDHAWYVQYGQGPDFVCRWVNCEFIALPIGQDTFERPIGERDGAGVTVTRGDLVSGLADFGFELRVPGE